MKGVLFLISVLLLSVAIDAKSLASNFMKIKESIKSLKPGGKRGMAGMGQAGVPSQRALERCFRYGRRGRYSVPGVIYRRDPNPNVKGNYINVEKLGYDPARTKTIYRFNCRKPEFSSTGLCQQIAQEKDGSECTKCFGTNSDYMEKTVQSMYGGILSQNDEKRDGNMKITLTIKCRKDRRSGYTRYTYVVEDQEDRPTSRRRRLLAGSRREGQCRL